MIKMQCTKAFHRLGRTVRAGEQFEATEDVAKFLEERGRAVRLPLTTSSGPTETLTTGPSEIKELGGGWYEVRGEKIQGREAAEEAAGKAD